MRYFTLNELCKSETATANHIINSPNIEEACALTALIEKCLDEVRWRYGKPITVTSGFRCQRLNDLVGGKKTSQHLKGEAADIIGKNIEETRRIFEIAREFGDFDQLLYEKNSKGKVWVHISYKEIGNRHQCIDNYCVR